MSKPLLIPRNSCLLGKLIVVMVAKIFCASYANRRLITFCTMNNTQHTNILLCSSTTPTVQNSVCFYCHWNPSRNWKNIKFCISILTLNFPRKLMEDVLSVLLLARGSVVVKALCYKPEGCQFDTWRGKFLNLPNPSGRTRPWGLFNL
jgi:hypothetical protein